MSRLCLNTMIFLLLPLYLFASDDMLCNYCHGNVFGVSGLQSKPEWRKLTSDGGKRLQKIHKNNLDVVVYLKSSAYDEKRMYDYISFYADSQREFIAVKIVKQCVSCHKSKMHLSSFWTKTQWESLESTLKSLKEVHQKQLKVMNLIESNSFNEVLPEFIKEITFHAPKSESRTRKDHYMLKKLCSEGMLKDTTQVLHIQKKGLTNKIAKQKSTKRITVDTNLTKPSPGQMKQIKGITFDLVYDTKKVSIVSAKKVATVLKDVLNQCSKKSQKLKISLYQTDTKIYTGDFFISFITIGMAPVRYADTWIMEVKKADEEFYSAIELVTVHGVLVEANKEDNEYIEDKVALMIADIIAQPDFKCK